MRITHLIVAGFALSLPQAHALADKPAGPTPDDALAAALSDLEAAKSALERAQLAYTSALAEAERSAADAGVTLAPAAPAPTKAPASVVAQPAEDAPPPEPTSFWGGWEGQVDAGLSGSSGNSENFSARGAIVLRRATSKMETTAGVEYKYGTSDGLENTNRFQADLRNDWLFPDSRWRWFAQGRFEADNFQDWDYRLSGYTGPAYELIRKDDQERDISLLLRAGVGGSQTIGGSDETFRPEAIVGADFEWDIKDGHRFLTTVEAYPALDPAGEFRLLARAAYEILLDKESNLYLTLGAEDRYDSQPGAGAKRNDVDYFLTLGWKF